MGIVAWEVHLDPTVDERSERLYKCNPSGQRCYGRGRRVGTRPQGCVLDRPQPLRHSLPRIECERRTLIGALGYRPFGRGCRAGIELQGSLRGQRLPRIWGIWCRGGRDHLGSGSREGTCQRDADNCDENDRVRAQAAGHRGSLVTNRAIDELLAYLPRWARGSPPDPKCIKRQVSGPRYNAVTKVPLRLQVRDCRAIVTPCGTRGAF